MEKQVKIPLHKSGDIDAALGTFFDSFSKIIIAVAMLKNVLKMPGELVYGQIIVSTGFTVFLFSLFNTFLARSLGKETKNKDITALFGGISGTTVFVWLSAVMLPTYYQSGDAVFAWSVTVAVSVIFSLLQLIFSFFIGYIFKYIPREALMGATVGGALTWMILSPLGEAYTAPWVIIPTLFILFTFYMGEIKPKFGSPALIAIGIGTAIAWLSGLMHINSLQESFSNIGFYLPSFQFGLLTSKALQTALNYLPLILAYLLAELTADMQAFAQAEGNGEYYPRRTALVGLSFSNLIGALLGNPFPLNYYWGHPAWKKANAGASYPLYSGALHLILCFSGLAAVVTSIIPANVSLVMLVFIGVISGAAAFSSARKRYYGAMMFGVAIPLFELVNNKINSLVNVLGTAGQNTVQLAEAGYASGFAILAQGAMTTAILYASILHLIIDHKWLRVAIFFFVSTLLSFIGLIHAQELAINPNPEISLSYLGLAFLFLIVGILCNQKKKNSKIKK